MAENRPHWVVRSGRSTWSPIRRIRSRSTAERRLDVAGRAGPSVPEPPRPASPASGRSGCHCPRAAGPLSRRISTWMSSRGGGRPGPRAAASQADSNVDSPSGPLGRGRRAGHRAESPGAAAKCLHVSRTMSCPTRAEVRQCTCRRSSPTTYSRRAANAILPCGNPVHPSVHAAGQADRHRRKSCGPSAVPQTFTLLPYRRTTPDQAERVAPGDLQRPDQDHATPACGHRVPHAGGLARAQPDQRHRHRAARRDPGPGRPDWRRRTGLALAMDRDSPLGSPRHHPDPGQRPRSTVKPRAARPRTRAHR